MLYDLIIIGGGPAALTAGIYGARKKLKILILADKPSWQVSSASLLENYPGFKSIAGSELLKIMREQLESYEVEMKDGAVIKIDKKDKGIFIAKTKDKEYSARAMIIASGRLPKKLGVVGEDEFIGRGVSYCATCDAPLFSGKNVAVIGGGNAGLEAALELASYAKKVYILEIGERFSGDEISQERLKKTGKVEFILNARTREIKGEKFVKALVYEDRKTGEIFNLEVEGIFVEIGSLPSIGFAKDLVEVNEFGEIVINPFGNETKTLGLFAAGDVTNVLYKQIIIAAGEGAKAALSAHKYLIKSA